MGVKIECPNNVGYFVNHISFIITPACFWRDEREKNKMPDSDSAAAKIVTFATKFQFASEIWCPVRIILIKRTGKTPKGDKA